MNWHKVAIGAGCGAVSAFLVDLHAWQKARQSGATGFDWILAASRWVGGALSGAAAAIGMEQAGA